MDREDTCHRTCFSLQLDGNTLDNFAELKCIEGLKEGSVIKVYLIYSFVTYIYHLLKKSYVKLCREILLHLIAHVKN